MIENFLIGNTQKKSSTLDLLEKGKIKPLESKESDDEEIDKSIVNKNQTTELDLI